MLDTVLGRGGSGTDGEDQTLPVTAPAIATTQGMPVTTSDTQTAEPHVHVGGEGSTGGMPTAVAVEKVIKADGEKPGKAKAVRSKKHRLKQLMYHRRRRRSDRAASSSEGESSEDSSAESESESDEERGRESGRFPRSSSEESLPVLLDEGLGEDDLDMLEELSDSSSASDGEELLNQSAKPEGGRPPPDLSSSGLPGSVSLQTQPKPLEQLSGSATALKTSETVETVGDAPTGTTSTAVPTSSYSLRHRYSSSKRQIVLAANFNLAPPSPKATAATAHGSPKPPPKPSTPPPHHEASTLESAATNRDEHTKPSAHSITQAAATTTPAAAVSDKGTNGLEDEVTLRQLLEETRLQTALHLVCSLAAEEGYLMVLRIFAEWLQSYPVVIATCGQVCGERRAGGHHRVSVVD